MAKLVIFYDRNRWLGKLTKFYTDSNAYHVGWVCDDEDKIYDMHLSRRRRVWSDVKILNEHILSRDFPLVDHKYLEHKLESDPSIYGFKDFLLFSIRPIYHLFGKTTRNGNGVICSEMTNRDLIICGYNTPWTLDDEPPSPADQERWINTSWNRMN